jgi:hypothetical protein
MDSHCDRRWCWRKATLQEEKDGVTVWARCDRHGQQEWLEAIARDSHERLYGGRRLETLSFLLKVLPDADVAAALVSLPPRLRPQAESDDASLDVSARAAPTAAADPRGRLSSLGA